MQDVAAILAEREKTHGSYAEHARITQGLKAFIPSAPAARHLTAAQREAVEMILHKMGRILAGNPNHRDHWDDIAGYATLVSQALTETKGA